MGCTVSKSEAEPHTVTIKLSGCSILSRSSSSPVQWAGGEHLAGNARGEIDHVVSLTSSTYGSLRLDSLPSVRNRPDRAASSSSMKYVASGNDASGRSGNSGDVKLGANRQQVETINMWELMDGIEGERVALQALRGLVGKSKVSERDSGSRSPRVYHTLEDVDSVLDIRGSLNTTDYRFRRGSSLESVNDRKTGIHSPVVHKRRSQALQVSQEVIEELDGLRRKNLSRSQEFSMRGRRNLSQSQELNSRGRGDVSRSQEFYSRARRNFSQSQDLDSNRRIQLTGNQEGMRNLSRSQDLDSNRRIKLTGNQEGMRNLSRSQDLDSNRRIQLTGNQEGMRNLSRSQDLDSNRRIKLTGNQEGLRNLSRSQEFVKPFLAEPKDGLATRRSSETLRAVQMKDESIRALSKPDVVLRSPMLRGLSGQERFVSSNAINIERRSKSLLQGQAQPAADWKTTSPRAAAGSTKVSSLNMNSPQRRSGKALEPRVASAVAALSRLHREQRESSMVQPETERKAEVFQDQSSKLAKVNYCTVSKAPTYSSVATFAENTQLIVPQDRDQDGRIITTKTKQTDRSSSVSTTALSGQKGQRAAMISSTSEALFQKKICEKSSRPEDMYSQEILLDDPISLDYELVTKAEVAEAVMRSGSLPAQQPRQSNLTYNFTRDTLTIKNTSWSAGSECCDSPPLDPELLASFEEALEMFTTDDWCTVRIGDSDDLAVTSGSTSDADSPSWLRESLDHLESPAGDPKLNKFEILENHIEKPEVANPKIIASSKVAVEELVVTKLNPLEKFTKKCPPGGEARCVLYTTSLRGIRKTFENCSQTRRILQYSNVQIDERDIAMHGEFRQEVNDLVGRAGPVPRLFIRGRYIGGAEEVAQLFEEGTLSALLEDLPRQVSHAVCCGCGGVRFVPCATCCGSCKVVTEEGTVACCQECNENGLCRCPLCL